MIDFKTVLLLTAAAILIPIATLTKNVPIDSNQTECIVAHQQYLDNSITSSMTYLNYFNGEYSNERFIRNKIHRAILAKDTYNSEETKLFISEKLYSLSKKYPTIEWELVLTVLLSESELNPNVQHKNSKVIGVGGVHYPSWYEELTRSGVINSPLDLYTIEAGIEASYHILYTLHKQYEDVGQKLIHRYKGLGYDHKLHKSGYELAKKTYEEYLKLKRENKND